MRASMRSRLLESMRAEAVGERWHALVAEFGTPLLVLDPQRVVAQYRTFTTHLKGVLPHYAVKAAPHPAVLNAVAGCGGGFDVATNAEVDLVRSLGIAMDRCIHTHPIKKIADIEHAYRAGIRTFVVDNQVEAQKFTGLPRDIEVLVRLAFHNPSAKHDLSAKFGADPAEAELLAKHVVTAGVRLKGFSFHVGTQSRSAEAYRTALQTTVGLAGHVGRTLGVPVTTIDIGGGFPVTYRKEMPDISGIGTVIDEVLGDDHGFTLLAEPGRYLAASSMTLLTSVVGTAIREGRHWHYLDDGLYGAYSNILTEDIHPPVFALSELDCARTDYEPVTLAGPTCDCVDVIARDYPMPPLRVGDVVVSQMMGAYTTVTSSRFNGIGETRIVVMRPEASL
jgi:ornithine decarboxylase